MSNIDLSGCVLVPIDRLRRLEELEALEATLPTIIAKAKEEAHAERLALLHARDKADPEGHKKRSANWKKAHKDEYNAKRREEYKLKKAAKASNAPAPPTAEKPPGVEMRPHPDN